MIAHAGRTEGGLQEHVLHSPTPAAWLNLAALGYPSNKFPPRGYVVTHISSGSGMAKFDDLPTAKRFCEQIEPLADWSVVPENRKVLSVPMHEIEIERAVSRSTRLYEGRRVRIHLLGFVLTRWWKKDGFEPSVPLLVP
jgi:hypothetical protein